MKKGSIHYIKWSFIDFKDSKKSRNYCFLYSHEAKTINYCKYYDFKSKESHSSCGWNNVLLIRLISNN